MTETITSTHNPRIRALRRLRDRRRREEEGVFVAEGEDLLAAALAADVPPRAVFAVPDPPELLAQLLAELPPHVERVNATATALAVAGSLGSGSRVIGVWELPDIQLRAPKRAGEAPDTQLRAPKRAKHRTLGRGEAPDTQLRAPKRAKHRTLGRGEAPDTQLRAPKRAKHRTLGRGEAPDIDGDVTAQDGSVLYLHDVADPGNVGTVLRAARAFGAPLVVMSERTADPFGPKAIRASMGAVFGQRLARASFEAARAALAPARAIALVPGAGMPLREAALGGPVLFALGAEREGLPPDVVAACEATVHVPVDRDAADSLNVAMTATLCLYEYRAQHA